MWIVTVCSKQLRQQQWGKHVHQTEAHSKKCGSCHATQSSMSERLTFRLSLLCQFVCSTQSRKKFKILDRSACIQINSYLHKQLNQLTMARNALFELFVCLFIYLIHLNVALEPVANDTQTYRWNHSFSWCQNH